MNGDEIATDFDPQVAAQIEKDERDTLALTLGPAITEALLVIAERRVRAANARRLYRELLGQGCLIYHEHGNLRVEPTKPLTAAQNDRVRKYRNELSDILDNYDTRLEPAERQQAPDNAPVPAKERQGSM